MPGTGSPLLLEPPRVHAAWTLPLARDSPCMLSRLLQAPGCPSLVTCLWVPGRACLQEQGPHRVRLTGTRDIWEKAERGLEKCVLPSKGSRESWMGVDTNRGAGSRFVA